MTDDLTISEEEADILQEIMNIAFGKAAADLAEIINIMVNLSVPKIAMLQAADLHGYLMGEMDGSQGISVIEQGFWGEFRGSAFLIFQSGAGKELISMLGSDMESAFEAEAADVLERETLMEVGNILIGACVGKVTELLQDVVTYSPPRVIVENKADDVLADGLFDPTYMAIVLKTLFCFNERNVNGLLFLVASQESIAWLKRALCVFMEQYE